MARNDLNTAQRAKKDEFYTRRQDIEEELKHYKEQLQDKIVLCNADDPYESNFFKYFASNFNYLGLKKLIATSFTKSPIAGQQLKLVDIEGLKPNGKQPFKIEINQVPDLDRSGSVNIEDVEYLLKNDKNIAMPLAENGDFRSDECVNLLKECDVVVTNPPFSLFRDFMQLIEKYNKKFLLIGNTNSFTYKEIFKMFKDNRIRTGYTNFNVGMFFEVPFDWQKYHHIDKNGKKLARVSTSCWVTNFEVMKHEVDITLYKKYIPKEYPTYDNYPAINVDRYTDIPYDYYGVVGVPITFLDKFNPNQFELIALGNSLDNFSPTKKYVNPKKILKDGEVRNGNAINHVLAINCKEKPVNKIHYISDNSDYLVAPYARILIKQRKASNEN